MLTFGWHLCVCSNKSLANKIKSSSSMRKMPYWLSDQVLLWLKKNCNNSYKLYGNLFKKHFITGLQISLQNFLGIFLRSL